MKKLSFSERNLATASGLAGLDAEQRLPPTLHAAATAWTPRGTAFSADA
jgi:hypothetical protein